jgi:hypothetical protein
VITPSETAGSILLQLPEKSKGNNKMSIDAKQFFT